RAVAIAHLVAALGDANRSRRSLFDAVVVVGLRSPFVFTVAAVRAIIAKTGCKNRLIDGRLPVDVSVIQQAKIQAQVLVPLVKALQAELGEERANSIVRDALGDIYRGYGEEFARAKNGRDLGKFMSSAFKTYARDGALDYKVVEQSEDAFAIDVTGCRYAEFYKELGEPELGFL